MKKRLLPVLAALIVIGVVVLGSFLVAYTYAISQSSHRADCRWRWLSRVLIDSENKNTPAVHADIVALDRCANH